MAVNHIWNTARRVLSAVPTVLGVRALSQVNSIPRSLCLVTASCGIPKPGFKTPKYLSKFSVGDDAFFIVKSKATDVIGKLAGWFEEEALIAH